MDKFNYKSPRIEDRVAETSILFDLYGGLLTEKKRTVMELYHEENLSLSEIAEEQGISRAAVHDSLRSAEKNLLEYERKLGLAEDYGKRMETVSRLREEIGKLVSSKDNQVLPETLENVEKLLSDLEE